MNRFVYACINISSCMSIHMYIHMNMHMNIHMNMHMYTHSIYNYIHIYIVCESSLSKKVEELLGFNAAGVCSVRWSIPRTVDFSSLSSVSLVELDVAWSKIDGSTSIGRVEIWKYQWYLYIYVLKITHILCVCIYVYIHIYIYVYIYMYICINIYAHW